MLPFSEPLWLILLLLVPVIRWIHRWQASLRRQVVPALFLWQGRPDAGDAGNRLSEPDPAWRRRAFAVALLVVALAGPILPGVPGRLTIWVDDSLSMFTLEGGQSRIESAFVSARQAAGNRGFDEVLVRSLGDPGFVRRYTALGDVDVGPWREREALDPLPPPGSLMSRESAHWLLTDGASPSVRQWAKRAPLDRIINVGQATENASIVLVGARRRTDSVSGLDIVVSASNAGSEAQQRSLLLEADGREVGEFLLSVDAGGSIVSYFRLPNLPRSVTARFRDTDNLPDDDELSLDLRAMQPVPVFLASDCPVSIAAVIDTHPGLSRAETPAASQVDFSCNVAEAAGVETFARPRVRAIAGTSRPVTEQPAWNLAPGRAPEFRLQTGWIDAADWPGGDLGGKAALVTSARPLINVTGSSGAPTIVDTVVNLQNEEFARQPEYALFVSELVAYALEKPILDPVPTVAREPGGVPITPVPIEAQSDSNLDSASINDADLTEWILAIALLVILWDSGMFVSRRRTNLP